MSRDDDENRFWREESERQKARADAAQASFVAAEERATKAEAKLADEISFSEGWQEHIGDLLDAMKPFVLTLKDGKPLNGSTLSLNHWHTLSKAFDAAAFALKNDVENPPADRDRLAAENAKLRDVLTNVPLSPEGKAKGGDLQS